MSYFVCKGALTIACKVNFKLTVEDEMATIRRLKQTTYLWLKGRTRTATLTEAIIFRVQSIYYHLLNHTEHSQIHKRQSKPHSRTPAIMPGMTSWTINTGIWTHGRRAANCALIFKNIIRNPSSI
jgi:hypothetical protein